MYDFRQHSTPFWFPLAMALCTAGAVALTGCASTPELVPAPNAQPAPPGPGKGAVAEVRGVTVIARSDAWSGFPPDLDRVTPILVTIENDGAVPVRIRYNEFSLEAPSTGASYAAIPPFDVRGTEVEPITRLGYRGFWVAPYYAPYYPGLRPYYGAFPFDQYYYDQYYPTWVNIELPTGDMVQKALPEGVLDPGGRVTGCLYFRKVKRGAGTVEFTDKLVNAATGAALGTIRIPFEVE
jgi:hypothetical protein